MKTIIKRRIMKILLTLVFIVIVILVSKRLVTPIIESEGMPKLKNKKTRNELENELEQEKEKLKIKMEECSVCDASLVQLTEQVNLLKEDSCVVVSEGLKGGV